LIKLVVKKKIENSRSNSNNQNEVQILSQFAVRLYYIYKKFKQTYKNNRLPKKVIVIF